MNNVFGSKPILTVTVEKFNLNDPKFWIGHDLALEMGKKRAETIVRQGLPTWFPEIVKVYESSSHTETHFNYDLFACITVGEKEND